MERSHEDKELWINAIKTRVMVYSTDLYLLHSSGELPCAVCCKEIGNTSTASASI